MLHAAANDFGSAIAAFGGWDRIGIVGVCVLFTMSFILGRVFPLSTLKRAWDSADRAWTAYNLEREARMKAEANSVKALEAVRENNRILDNLRPREGGGDRERQHERRVRQERQEEVDVALADRQGD